MEAYHQRHRPSVTPRRVRANEGSGTLEVVIFAFLPRFLLPFGAGGKLAASVGGGEFRSDALRNPQRRVARLGGVHRAALCFANGRHLLLRAAPLRCSTFSLALRFWTNSHA